MWDLALPRLRSTLTQLPSELDQLTSLGHLILRQAEKIAQGALVGCAATCSPALVVVILSATKLMYLAVLAVVSKVALRHLLGLSARLLLLAMALSAQALQTRFLAPLLL